MERLKAFRNKVLNFREKVRGLSKWQKFLVLVLVAAVPAGIALATLLLIIWKRKPG